MTEPQPGVKDRQVFKQRAITSAIGVPIVIALIWFGSPWFTVLVAAFGLGGAYEFYNLVKRSKGFAPVTYFGLLWVLLFILSPYVSRIPHLQGIPPSSFLFTLAVILPLLFLLWRKGKTNGFANWAWTLAGILYIGWLLSYFVALRNGPDGRGWVFLVILCTFASDIFAYLVGRVWGRHKMAPYVSPKKSWEGAVAAVVGSTIISLILVFVSNLAARPDLFNLPLGYGPAVVLGILISIIGQCGDLVKSLFKRNMEVKDSGNVLPGHGGFLDRTDSLAFAGVLVFYFVAFITPG
jgi:phosphatidate cytidylyltransferase